MSTQPPRIPDYALLRRIGSGAYGEVWLARGVTGLHRAVKIVYRSGFADSRPYEREFSGIKKFQAVSHAQENLVNILHVGRNDEAGYFFYVMELADAADTLAADGTGPPVGDYRAPGSELDTRGYQSGTLKQCMLTHGRLPVGRCVAIAKGLTRAIEHLHRHGLIHRDIKPSNVIFVNRVPKLADVGLVAGLDESRSFVGTEGFVPPEGPGTVGADLFALGRLLYEMSSGRDRLDYPRLPEDFDQLEDRAALLEFNEIVLKAGDPERQRRYSSADELVRDLLLLEAGKSVRRLRLLETRFALALRAAAVAVAVTLIAVAAWLWAAFQAREAHRNYAASERHRLTAEAALRDGLLNQVRANRQSGWTGQRLESLRLLRENPAITNSLAFRSEAIACLALPDARPERAIPLPRGNSGARWAVDRQITRYATNDPSGGIWVRAVADDRLLHVLPTPGASVFRYGFSEDDRMIGASYVDRRFVAWPLESFPAAVDGPMSPWSGLADSQRPARVRLPGGAASGTGVPGGRELAVLDTGGRLHFINSTNGAVSRVLVLNPVPVSIRFNATGLKLAGHRSNECFVYRASDGAKLVSLVHSGPVTAFAWHPDGRRLATTSFDFKIRMWDTQSGLLLSGFEDHEAEAVGVDFDETGTLLASTSWDDTTRLWGPESARALVRIRGSGNSLRLAADGSRLGYSTWDHEKLIVLQILPGRERISLERANGTYGLAFSPDSRFLVAGNSTTLNVWQWPYFQPVAVLPVASCSRPGFSPDGRWLATAGSGAAVEWPFLADHASGQLRLGPSREIIPIRGDSQLFLSSDGSEAALATDRRTRLLSRGQEGWQPGATWNHKVYGVSFARDRQWRAVARSYEHLEIQDSQGHAVTNFDCGNASVSGFSPDGRWLVVSQPDRYQAYEVGSWRAGPAVLRNAPMRRRSEHVGFSAEAPLAVLRTDDRQVSLVDLGTWQTVAWFPVPLHATAATLSPDGTKLGVATEKSGIEVWDVARIRAGLVSMGLDWPGPRPAVSATGALQLPTAPRLQPSVLVDAPRLTNASPSLAARLPPRAVATPAACLDLSNYYNASLSDGWIPAFKLGLTSEHNLPVPPGLNRFGNLLFDVRGAIQLASTTLAARNGMFPDQVSGIPVGRRCQRLHFLHGTDWRGKHGSVVGGYAIRYLTGEEEIVWLTYGRDLIDWWVDPPADAGTNAPIVAWTGSNTASRRQNSSIRVYRTTWENPRWDVPIQSIDFASTRTATGPFLLAITVD